MEKVTCPSYGGITFNTDKAIGEFMIWRNSGYAKSEVPSSESLEVAIKSLKLSIPQLVVRTSPYEPAWCPTCNFRLSISLGDGYYKDDDNERRCFGCGQRIIWEE